MGGGYDGAAEPVGLAEALQPSRGETRRPQRLGDQQPVAHRWPIAVPDGDGPCEIGADELIRLPATGLSDPDARRLPHHQLIAHVRRDQPANQQPPFGRLDHRRDQRLQIPRQLGLADRAVADAQPHEDERAHPRRVDPRRLRARRVHCRHRHVSSPQAQSPRKAHRAVPNRPGAAAIPSLPETHTGPDPSGRTMNGPTGQAPNTGDTGRQAKFVSTSLVKLPSPGPLDPDESP